MVGAVRRFRLADGAVLRERLLTLSDTEKTFSYCLLDTPIPLLNYVAHVAAAPRDRRRAHVLALVVGVRHPARTGAQARHLVGEDIYMRGFAAIRRHLAA